MGSLRLSRVLRARIAVLLGALLVAVGVTVVFSVGWALIVVGVAVVSVFLFLYDVDETPSK